jgi:DNA-binding response OmpR family regulator
MKGDQERCLAAGMDDYISKPINAKTLSAAISRVLTGVPPLDFPSGESPVCFALAAHAES